MKSTLIRKRQEDLAKKKKKVSKIIKLLFRRVQVFNFLFHFFSFICLIPIYVCIIDIFSILDMCMQYKHLLDI